WNGDVSVLRYFVDPTDAEVFRFTRAAINNSKSLLDTISGERRNFACAGILFDEFAKTITYVNDPKKSQDNVQYPAETLHLHGGDCDDFSVAYAALLSSIGISVAFVDVVPPDHPDSSHIYMLFDSGISADRSGAISGNPKRIVVRKNEHGDETVWIPVEPTAITHGFAEAWNTGANEYYQDVELHLGFAKGWVKVVDLQIMQ
ncbi:MAG TPA: transglutaminase domain-containing protein, partial [Bacteroidota bacterium]|nr:transglutaminase domain-containing protein [Bacteroidota bacterium]